MLKLQLLRYILYIYVSGSDIMLMNGIILVPMQAKNKRLSGVRESRIKVLVDFVLIIIELSVVTSYKKLVNGPFGNFNKQNSKTLFHIGLHIE